ncbi:MAG: ATP-binding cassette domain-containing protein [Actinobacteria bacterium]|nr:ATP-binding cassette domain-containing protein [Actinomycetota bacterium]MCL5446495.1 ATP-binding cassette domain-containing protein [Actinomycetota bacterium]
MELSSLIFPQMKQPQRKAVFAGVWVLGIAVAYLILRQVLPSGLPPGVIFQGVVLGGLTSLTAMGLVLIYRATRIFNFAQSAMGGIAAAVAVIAVTGERWSYWVAIIVGLLVAVVVGVLIDLVVVKWFSKTPRLIFTVATIGIAQILGAGEVALPDMFHNISPTTTFTTPFSASFTINPITFNGNYVIALAVVPLALLGLYWFFQTTDTGIAIRASADSEERATLLGIPVKRLSMIVWVVATVLSGVAAILTAPIKGISLGVATGPESLLIPLAAAVLAGMDSLPMAVVWSIALRVLDQGVYWSYHQSTYVRVAAFFFILVALLFRRREQKRTSDAGLGGYVAFREIRPIPVALARMKEIRAARQIGYFTLGAVVLVVLPLAFNATWLTTFTFVAIYGLLAVSVVMLSGWGGQISLGQYAIAGVGAATTGALLVHLHVELLLAMLASALVGAVAAVVMGIPALRIPGLYLAVITLAFAVMTSTWLLSSNFFPLFNPANVPRPVLFGRFDLNSQRWMYVLSALVLIVGIYLAANFRNSRAGRAIVAMRDNARAASAYGISSFRAKLTVFAISGAIAGLAGSLLVLQNQGIGYAGFDPNESVMIFAVVVVGGLGSLSGGLLGAVFFELMGHLPGAWQYLAQGAGLLVILMIAPEGLGWLYFAARDRLLGTFVKRRGITGDLHGAPAPSVTVASKVDADGEAILADTLGDYDGNQGWDGGARRSLARSAALRLGALEDLEVAMDAQQDAGKSHLVAPYAGPPTGRVPIMGVSDVDLSIGSSQVLYNVNFSIAQGEVLALLGTNGAGKTTTLRTLAGLMQPGEGRISFVGRDITRESATDRVRSGLVAVLGGRGIFPSLTVEENLTMGAWMVKHSKSDDALAFVEAATDRVFQLFPQLHNRLRSKAELLSGGEQQMLALSQALLCRPKLLMIDELSLGLAPTVVNDLLKVVTNLAKSGVTIVVVEQSINVATAISNRAVFMERGRIRFSGPTPDLSQQPKLLRSVFTSAAMKARVGRTATQGFASASMSSEHPTESREPEPTQSRVQPVTSSAAPAQPGIAMDGMASSGMITSAVGLGGIAASERKAGNGCSTVPAFEVVGVSKQYGGVAALHDVSVQVGPGEIVGIIGTNGAGKTTLFDVCSGFLKPDQGRVFLSGEDITALAPSQRASRGLGRVFQDARLFPAMTVLDAIATACEQHVAVKDPIACTLGLAAAKESEAEIHVKALGLLRDMGLERFRGSFVSELSTGTRRILEFTCLLAHEPKVLLLDEPTSGIAQRESEALGELILGLREETGAAFLVIEHDVPLVASISDRLVCMHIGEVIAEGDTADVLENSEVMASYLGTEEDSPLSGGGTHGKDGGVLSGVGN